MNENGNDRIRVMEILNQSQYNDEVIDGLDMSNLDLTFSDFSEVMAEGIMAKTSPFKSFLLMRASFLIVILSLLISGAVI